MNDKIKNLLTKYRELIVYLVFGVLTTVVNFVIYFAMKAILGIEDDSDSKALMVVIANAVAWVFSVAFAFVTNKLFVFSDKDKTASKLLFQIATFVSARLLSFLFETVCLYVSVDVLAWNEDIVKVVVAVVVVLLNYVASKLVVFRKKI